MRRTKPLARGFFYRDGVSLIVGVPKETFPGERRVALVPGVLPTLGKAGIRILLESGAGILAGYPDSAYGEKGAKIVASRAELFVGADVILPVLAFGANPVAGRADNNLFRAGQAVICLCNPLGAPESIREAARLGVTLFSLELLPRITRAQLMDVLSSMSTVAGYKAVLLAAAELPRMFPLLMTAAGTVSPARVFVVGAGVAGLTAIATARRLGAVVEAYDVRPAVREQVESREAPRGRGDTPESRTRSSTAGSGRRCPVSLPQATWSSPRPRSPGRRPPC